MELHKWILGTRTFGAMMGNGGGTTGPFLRTDRMRRCLLLLVLALAVSLTGPVAGFQAPPGQTIRLRFPEGIDLTRLEIRYFLSGPFGGYGTFVRTDPTIREYDVEVARPGGLAKSFKAMIHRPGYRFVVLTESVIEGQQTRTIPIQFEPLGSTPLTGEVILARPVVGLTMEAVYLASWGHEFYGIVDGFVQQFHLGTSKIAPDGTFTLNVPDFMRDPVVASYAAHSRGSILLSVHDSSPGNRVYRLEDVTRRGRSAEVPIASEYPERLQLAVTTN